MQDAHKFIHFVMGVVERERRTHGALEAEVPLRRHRTVVSGADGDAVLVEMPRDVFVRHARNDEREHARLVLRGPDWPQAGHGGERLRRVFQQFVFVGRECGNADGGQVVDRGAEADHARDIRRAGLEFFRRVLVDRSLRTSHRGSYARRPATAAWIRAGATFHRARRFPSDRKPCAPRRRRSRHRARSR